MLLHLLTLTVMSCGGCLATGLASTPPMGWQTWERFQCITDCKNYPDDCISEKLVKSTADAMVKSGLSKLGYQYLQIDDCWQAKKRDSQGRLQPDQDRFPSGMKPLAEYLHAKGLKLGLYTDTGNETGNGNPGSGGHYDLDAQTFAAWGVDMVKVETAMVKDARSLNKLYVLFGQSLKKTGRAMLYRCGWALEQRTHGMTPNYTLVNHTCHTFRTYKDLIDSWTSLENLLKWYDDNSRQLAQSAGHGSWNDPDSLLAGNFGLSINQLKLQTAIWSIMAAPLFISADIRKMTAVPMAIVANQRMIDINQDTLGLMGYHMTTTGQVKVYIKPVKPQGSMAMAIVYTNISGGPKKVQLRLADIGYTTAGAYNFTDVFTGQFLGTVKPWYTYNCEVNPTGVLYIYALAIP